jgi:hypothetical protein
MVWVYPGKREPSGIGEAIKREADKNMEEEWAFLMQAFNDLEAEIVCGLLQEASIPVRQKDSDSLTGAMRVVGGQAYEIDIFVPLKMLPRARALLAAAFREEAAENKEE